MCQLRHIALCFCICRLKTWQPEKPVYLIIDFSAYIFETRLSKVALEKFPVNVEFPILFSQIPFFGVFGIFLFFHSLAASVKRYFC